MTHQLSRWFKWDIESYFLWKISEKINWMPSAIILRGTLMVKRGMGHSIKACLDVCEQRLSLACQSAVWSDCLMITLLITKDTTFLQADNKVSDQTVLMSILIWVFAGQTCPKAYFLMLPYAKIKIKNKKIWKIFMLEAVFWEASEWPRSKYSWLSSWIPGFRFYSDPARGEYSFWLYGVSLHRACHYHPVIILIWLNLYHSLGIFSRRQTDDIFLIFPRKQDLTFHANCLLRRQFAWNVKSCFLGKIRKIFQNVVCWNFYPEC